LFKSIDIVIFLNQKITSLLSSNVLIYENNQNITKKNEAVWLQIETVESNNSNAHLINLKINEKKFSLYTSQNVIQLVK